MEGRKYRVVEILKRIRFVEVVFTYGRVLKLDKGQAKNYEVGSYYYADGAKVESEVE